MIKQPVSTFILLDRSGSMERNWKETITAINSYVETLGKDAVEGDRTTLATFDSPAGYIEFEVIRDRVSPKDWSPVDPDKVTPRGMTPLFDAVGKIVTEAEKHGAEKTVVVVMTDGHENSSREFTKATATAALDRIKAKGWEVVFLGANFDQIGDQAASLGVLGSHSVSASPMTYQDTFVNLAVKSRSYSTMNASMAFTDKDREISELKNKS